MRKILTAIALLGLTLGGAAHAADITPDFAGAPTGWATDRYQPAAFGDIGTYAGSNHALGITVDESTAAGNRPAGQQGTFYDTQGMSHTVAGAAGDSLAAALYVPESWADPANGFRRTDMWGVMTDGTGVSGYPIIGMVSSTAYTGFQYWNDSAGTWVHLGSTPVKYNSWNVLGIAFDGSNYDFSVNGMNVGSVLAQAGTIGFQDLIMQAVNPMGDPAYAGEVTNGYTAHWANASAVPEPSTLAMFGFGAFVLAFLYTRGRNGQHNSFA